MDRESNRSETVAKNGSQDGFNRERRRWLRLLAGAPFLASLPGLATRVSAATPVDPIEQKLLEMGLSLPPAMKTPPGVEFPFVMVRVLGKRAIVSGHGPQVQDGTLSPVKGHVGAQVSIEEGYEAAKLTGLSILGSLKRELGSLDRVTNWGRVFGMVASAPGFGKQPAVINGFSDLILELYGAERGAHSRSAVGMAELPFGIPVEIEAEVEIA